MAITKITTPELFNLQSNNTEGTQLPVMTIAERIAMTGMSNGELIFNSTTDSVEYYDLDATAWYKIDYEITEYEIEYLVIAGGGGAYYSGGGAGGYRTNVSTDTSGRNSSAEPAFAVVAGTVYTIIVGSGGTGSYNRSNGANSSFESIISLGGGAGSPLWNNNGLPGGSGGGSNVLGSSGGTRSGGAGTTGQGYQGGASLGSTPDGDATSGGGGAGGVGAAAYNYSGSGWLGSAGGAGLVSSIDGLSLTRARGGQGGTSNPGAPTANSGNGAGWVDGGADGVVIIRMKSTAYSGTTTGSPVVSIVGTDTVLTYNSSGSYTA